MAIKRNPLKKSTVKKPVKREKKNKNVPDHDYPEKDKHAPVQDPVKRAKIKDPPVKPRHPKG